VLFGTDYWSGLLAWLRSAVLPGGKIGDNDMRIFHVTDSPAEVLEILNQSQSSLQELDKLVSDEIRLPS
jgi:predicted Rossmann-fold nucleotide-binding protein